MGTNTTKTNNDRHTDMDKYTDMKRHQNCWAACAAGILVDRVFAANGGGQVTAMPVCVHMCFELSCQS